MKARISSRPVRLALEAKKSGGSSSGSASGADTSKYTVLYSSQPATLNYLTTATDLEMSWVQTAWTPWSSTTTRA